MIEEILKKENPVQLVISLEDLRSVIHEIQNENKFSSTKSIEIECKTSEKAEDRYLTRDEAATFCHVSKSTIWRWKKTGLLKSCRFGHKLLFKQSVLEEFMSKYETELL